MMVKIHTFGIQLLLPLATLGCCLLIPINIRGSQVVKAINSARRQEAAAEPEAPSAPTPEQALLTEIRDLLKK